MRNFLLWLGIVALFLTGFSYHTESNAKPEKNLDMKCVGINNESSRMGNRCENDEIVCYDIYRWTSV